MEDLSDKFGSALYFKGVVTLSQGFLFTSIIWSACMVFIIDREFERAAGWMVMAAVLSMIGLIHGYDQDQFKSGCYRAGIKNQFGYNVAPEFGFGYFSSALILLFLQWYDQGALTIYEWLRHQAERFCPLPMAAFDDKASQYTPRGSRAATPIPSPPTATIPAAADDAGMGSLLLPPADPES